jgi:hopene-associated glycosyltransferase HpnB
MTTLLIAALACVAWVYLLLFRGGFWRTGERDDAGVAAGAPHPWPRVVAVIPARNEAEVIAATVGSLLRQDYPGRFEVVVVDDHSTDGTAGVVRETAAAAGAAGRTHLLCAPELAEGWTGKLAAANCGVAWVDALPEPPTYLLCTDADIHYAPDALTTLVQRAEQDGLVLTSLMAKLRCESFAEHALIPAFIFFFRMLYPFAWVNRPESPVAAAAGGCMLVRRDALQAAGGFAAIRHALIDDCALGRLLKPRGPIWLGLTERVTSLRACPHLGDIRLMVRRSAYAQLKYSPWWLAGASVGMAITYLAPPLLVASGEGLARWLAAIAWLLMAFALQPTLRFYAVSRWWGLALPAIAAAYLAFTLDSAWQHWRGRGGLWKGRAYAPLTTRR